MNDYIMSLSLGDISPEFNAKTSIGETNFIP
jgi:hypothetical protein